MTSQNTGKSPEYRDAMRLLRQLARKHGLQVSSEQRKIFWAGVVYGVGKERNRKRASSRAVDTRAENGGTTHGLDQPSEPELDKGGMFQL